MAESQILNYVEYLCHVNIMKGMTTNVFKLWGAFMIALTLSLGAEESAPKQISIWAPGMDEPQLFSSQDGEVRIELGGSYWAYLIKGISGGIALGSENEEGNFWNVADHEPNGWGGKNSWANVGLEVNGYSLLETGAFFSVSGDHPTVSSDRATAFFPNSILVQADANGMLVLSIAPLVNSFLGDKKEGSANEDPIINLTLLADIYRKPPETSGNLSARRKRSSNFKKVTLRWNFSQGEKPSSYNGEPLATL